MSSPTYTFKQHPLTPPERLWLTERARSPGLSAKFAKVKLYGQLPPDFSPDHIDPRLYAVGRPTPMGLWHVDQSNSLFHAMDQTILEVQRRIRADPTLTTVTAAEIAEGTNLTEVSVAEALYAVGNLGHFFTQAQGLGGSSAAHSSIQLTDDTAYDEYLRYTDLDELLERVYVQRGTGVATSLAYSKQAEQAAQGTPRSERSEATPVEREEDPNWIGVTPDVQRAIQAV